MSDMILQELTQTFNEMGRGFAHFVPRLAVMLIIVLVGWLVAYLLKQILRGILRLSKFERLSESAGTARMLSKAALPTSTELLTGLVFWIAWLGFILLGISQLRIVGLQEHVSQIFLFLPRILVALLIVFFGLVVASFLARVALLAAVNANSPSPRLISAAVRTVLIALALAMAFEQLGLAEQTIIAAFSILFGALMFGLALAFGLGGKDLARRALERRFGAEQPSHERENELSHL